MPKTMLHYPVVDSIVKYMIQPDKQYKSDYNSDQYVKNMIVHMDSDL